jgi:hypothetical protein
VTDLLHTARELSRVLEPFVGCVYFAPDTHQAYVDLGFSPSARSMNGVAMPDGPAYFTSRGSLLGQVHGTVVASAFAVFSPAVVLPSVAAGWTRTDADTIRAARQAGTLTFLNRILATEFGPQLLPQAEAVSSALSRAVATCSVEGRPLFAGVMSEAAPSDPLASCWFLGDALREFRGDSHTATWVAEGLTAIEIGLLTELWWGLPLKTYVRTRAWTDQQLDDGITRLQEKGFIANDAFTIEGRALRSTIELRTDAHLTEAMKALGNDADTVIAILDQWSACVRAHHGYPAAGPQDLVSQR